MINQDLLSRRVELWRNRLLGDASLASRWDDILFSVFGADERIIKPTLKKIKRYNLFDGVLKLVEFGSRGEIRLSAEVPEHAQSLVSTLILLTAAEAAPGHPLQVLLISSQLDRLFLWSFEQIQWSLVPEWAQERLYNSALSMISIEGGRYTIGGVFEDEKPNFSTYLDSFEVSRYPVLQLTYEATIKQNPSVFIGASRPVDNISWYDSVRFCNTLSRNHGLEEAYEIEFGDDPQVHWNREANGFRLLSEAEWEVAARGGEEHLFSGSNRLADVAWFRENTNRQTCSVARRQPNGYGLYDMSGNLFEWCWDWYGCYPDMGVKNYAGPADGERKVRRGGSWKSALEGCTVSFRSDRFPHYTSDNLGFRIARSIG